MKLHSITNNFPISPSTPDIESNRADIDDVDDAKKTRTISKVTIEKHVCVKRTRIHHSHLGCGPPIVYDSPRTIHHTHAHTVVTLLFSPSPSLSFLVCLFEPFHIFGDDDYRFCFGVVFFKITSQT